MQSFLPPCKSELWDLVMSGEVKPYGRSIVQIVAELSCPIPFNYIEWKPVYEKRQLKDRVPYLGHDTITLILNYVAPGWSSEIAENQIGDRAVILCKLSIPAAEGIIVRSATGNDDLSDVTYGGALCDSEAMAFRRAAKHFGLGLALWDNDYVAELKRQRKSSNTQNSVSYTPEIAQNSVQHNNGNGHTLHSSSANPELANQLRILAKQKDRVNWTTGYIRQEFKKQNADELSEEQLKKLIGILQKINPGTPE